MAHRLRACLIVLGLLVALARPAAAAADADETAGTPAATGEAPKAPPVDLGEELPVERPADLSYGVAIRAVWVSVPQWLLHPFVSQNVPLSSWGTGIQFYRRKGNFDIALSFNYQNMSPPPGNWLGNGNKPETDTSYLVFQNFAMYGIDGSFIWHTFFTNWFGMHYGAGIGIGILGGTIERTKMLAGCNAMNVGDTTMCKPGAGSIGPAPLQSVPPVVPILNGVLGVDFRVPKLRGWSAKIEGGFYDAFFLGGGVGYTF